MDFRTLLLLLSNTNKELKELGLSENEIQNVKIVEIDKFGITRELQLDFEIAFNTNRYYLLIKDLNKK